MGGYAVKNPLNAAGPRGPTAPAPSQRALLPQDFPLAKTCNMCGREPTQPWAVCGQPRTSPRWRRACSWLNTKPGGSTAGVALTALRAITAANSIQRMFAAAAGLGNVEPCSVGRRTGASCYGAVAYWQTGRRKHWLLMEDTVPPHEAGCLWTDWWRHG